MTLRGKLFWLTLFYFVQGMPFGVFQDVLPVYLRAHGVSLTAIGVMTALTLPWTVKALWSPILDRFGARRTWVAGCCFALSAVMFCLPLLDASHPDLVFLLLILAFTMSSATQDIAIDAFSVDVAAKGEEGIINSFRAGAYRLGVMAAGGAIMYLVAPFGWTWVFLGLSLAFAVMALGALLSPPVAVTHQPVREWAEGFVAFLKRPGSIAIFSFVVLYKIGDVVMGPMVKPFWIDRGMTPGEIATISTNAGMALGILGAALGGMFVVRFGIFHGLWVLGLGQAISNLGYWGVAQFSLGWPYLYGASMFESFTQGLGTAAFLSFLMRICDKRQAATQYALFSALYALPRSIVAPFAGKVADVWGYPVFFFLTFVIALPAYAFLPWVHRWIGGNGRLQQSAGDSAETADDPPGTARRGTAGGASSPGAERRPDPAPAR